MAEGEFVELRVSGGSVRYGGITYKPAVDANYLNGQWFAFGLYYEPGELIEVGGQKVRENRRDDRMISLWGTPDMLRIMRSKGWPSQWKQRDLQLLLYEGSRLPLLFWRTTESLERG